MGQVFHAKPDTHARVLAHCKANGLVVKEFVDAAILGALEGGSKASTPVEKKRLPPTFTRKDSGPAPWELPPFWERRGTVEAAPEPEEDEDDEIDNVIALQPTREIVGGEASTRGEPFPRISEMKLLGG